jgi:cytochrome c oxidase assembly factor CtaG
VNCCAAISTGSNRATAGARIAHGGPRLRTLARRCRETTGWIIPSSILVLLPKCPACIAAYFAIGSGIGISVSTALYVRMALVVLCVGSLLYLAASRGRRFIAWRRKWRPSKNIYGTSSTRPQSAH